MFGIRIKNSILVEVNFPSLTLNGRYSFPDVPELRKPGVKIEGIQAIGATYLAISPSQKTVVPDADMSRLLVTFAVGTANTEEIQQYPLLDLYPYYAGGNIRLFNDKQIILSKSNVQMVDTGGTLAANMSVLFNFLYYSATR